MIVSNSVEQQLPAQRNTYTHTHTCAHRTRLPGIVGTGTTTSKTMQIPGFLPRPLETLDVTQLSPPQLRVARRGALLQQAGCCCREGVLARGMLAGGGAPGQKSPKPPRIFCALCGN